MFKIPFVQTEKEKKMARIFDVRSVVMMIMGAVEMGFLLKRPRAEEWKKFVESGFPWINIDLVDMGDGDFLPGFECPWEIVNPYSVRDTLSKVVEIPSLEETSKEVENFIRMEVEKSGEWISGPREFRGKTVYLTGNIFRGGDHRVWESELEWFREIAKTEQVFAEHLQAESKRADAVKRWKDLSQKYQEDWEVSEEEVRLVKEGKVSEAIERVLRRLL